MIVLSRSNFEEMLTDQYVCKGHKALTCMKAKLLNIGNSVIVIEAQNSFEGKSAQAKVLKR